MIQAIAAANSYLFQDELADYFRVRHEIFVGERGWHQVARPDGLEKDQFDTKDAIYILGIENHRIYGGARTRTDRQTASAQRGLSASRSGPGRAARARNFRMDADFCD